MPKDQKILEAIAKTGFVLEHDVVTSLQNEGWKTMSGSYYIDDVSNQKSTCHRRHHLLYSLHRKEDGHERICALC